MQRSLLDSADAYPRAGARENRLTEIFAAVLRTTPELVRWLVRRGFALETDEDLAWCTAGSYAVDTQFTLGDGSERPDMRIWCPDADRPKLFIEDKIDAAFTRAQKDGYRSIMSPDRVIAIVPARRSGESPLAKAARQCRDRNGRDPGARRYFGRRLLCSSDGHRTSRRDRRPGDSCVARPRPERHAIASADAHRHGMRSVPTGGSAPPLARPPGQPLRVNSHHAVPCSENAARDRRDVGAEVRADGVGRAVTVGCMRGPAGPRAQNAEVGADGVARTQAVESVCQPGLEKHKPASAVAGILWGRPDNCGSRNPPVATVVRRAGG